jgi:hypothetical protein
MVVEIWSLPRAEIACPPVGRSFHEAGRLEDKLVEAKPSQVVAIDSGGNKNISLIAEADESAIKEMVRIRREKQPVHSIKPLMRCLAGAPWLYVTRP